MKQVLMCRPTYFDVVYDINPWMTNNQKFVNHELAEQQWNILYANVRSAAAIKLVEPNPSCPDMVFTANAGFYFGNNQVIVSRFKHAERQVEEPVFTQWFEDNGYTIHTVRGNFEGQGDLLRDADDRLWLGTGFRTDNTNVVEELEEILQQYINVLELVDSRWYHLDTCFCPLPNGELLWYPGAFNRRSQELIRNSFDITIDICEEDALQFICNAVCTKDYIFLPVYSVLVSSMLKKLGYEPKFLEFSEFLKSGGAAKCLVMDIGNI
jgi:N-dimethylarginine dimethylaminohydrolase